MSRPPSSAERCVLIYHDPAELVAKEAGSWTIEPDGRISELTPAPGFEAYLAFVAKALNEAAHLFIRGAPEPAEGPGAVYLAPIARGDARFSDALREEAAKYYALEMRPP